MLKSQIYIGILLLKGYFYTSEVFLCTFSFDGTPPVPDAEDILVCIEMASNEKNKKGY